MLMLVASTPSSDLQFFPAALAELDEVTAFDFRYGDIFRFAPTRAAVEIVAGFRPGCDRIIVEIEEGAPRGARVVTTEERGNAVIRDGNCRRIVLEGIGLADLEPGDIEVERAG